MRDETQTHARCAQGHIIHDRLTRPLPAPFPLPLPQTICFSDRLQIYDGYINCFMFVTLTFI